MLCVLMKILSRASEKKRRQKGLTVSDFALLLVVFKRRHGSEGGFRRNFIYYNCVRMWRVRVIFAAIVAHKAPSQGFSSKTRTLGISADVSTHHSPGLHLAPPPPSQLLLSSPFIIITFIPWRRSDDWHVASCSPLCSRWLPVVPYPHRGRKSRGSADVWCLGEPDPQLRMTFTASQAEYYWRIPDRGVVGDPGGE